MNKFICKSARTIVILIAALLSPFAAMSGQQSVFNNVFDWASMNEFFASVTPPPPSNFPPPTDGPGSWLYTFLSAKPGKPADFKVNFRVRNSVLVSWMDNSRREQGYQVFRRPAYGEWQMIAQRVTHSDPIFGENAFRDRGLKPDTRYGYLVRAYNSYAVEDSPIQFIYSAGDIGEVWRAQLKIKTADVSGAGTDDGVNVALNSRNEDMIPSGNNTWVNYSHDDFERDAEFTYDLNTKDLSHKTDSHSGDLTDIHTISIRTNGPEKAAKRAKFEAEREAALPGENSDWVPEPNPWAIESVALWINGVEVFSKDYGNEGYWLNSDNGYSLSIGHHELRSDDKWKKYKKKHDGRKIVLLNNGIPNKELASRIESHVGDFIHGTELYWGHISGSAVEVSGGGCPVPEKKCVVHVNLDLAADPDHIPYIPFSVSDPKVDIDFDLIVSCGESRLLINSANVIIEADSNWYWEALSLYLIQILDWKVGKEIRNQWEIINDSFGGVPSCSLFVNADGDIKFE